MEGVTGDHAALETAISRWSADELKKIEREIVKPSFLRAQVGFNNNVKYKERTFHIQTEDSGLDKPHVITHLLRRRRRASSRATSARTRSTSDAPTSRRSSGSS